MGSTSGAQGGLDPGGPTLAARLLSLLAALAAAAVPTLLLAKWGHLVWGTDGTRFFVSFSADALAQGFRVALIVLSGFAVFVCTVALVGRSVIWRCRSSRCWRWSAR